jgi:hypothetical protein
MNTGHQFLWCEVNNKKVGRAKNKQSQYANRKIHRCLHTIVQLLNQIIIHPYHTFQSNYTNLFNVFYSCEHVLMGHGIDVKTKKSYQLFLNSHIDILNDKLYLLNQLSQLDTTEHTNNETIPINTIANHTVNISDRDQLQYRNHDSITTQWAQMTLIYCGNPTSTGHATDLNASHSFLEVQWDQIRITSNGVQAIKHISRGTKFIYLAEIIEQKIATQRIHDGHGQFIVKTTKSKYIDGNPTNPM